MGEEQNNFGYTQEIPTQSLICKPKYCPNCGSAIKSIQEISSFGEGGYDSFCSVCKWSGDIFPDDECDRYCCENCNMPEESHPYRPDSSDHCLKFIEKRGAKACEMSKITPEELDKLLVALAWKFSESKDFEIGKGLGVMAFIKYLKSNPEEVNKIMSGMSG